MIEPTEKDIGRKVLYATTRWSNHIVYEPGTLATLPPRIGWPVSVHLDYMEPGTGIQIQCELLYWADFLNQPNHPAQ